MHSGPAWKIVDSLGSDLVCDDSAKPTKKVGIVGKYGTHYGASFRKMVKKIGTSQPAMYTCKTKMNRW